MCWFTFVIGEAEARGLPLIQGILGYIVTSRAGWAAG